MLTLPAEVGSLARSRRRPLASAWIVAACAALALLGSCAHDEISTGTWVHRLEIRGARAVSAGDLAQSLATRKTGWWPFASKQWFDEAAFDVDLRRIPAFYADRGFFDARVTGHQVQPYGKDGVDIVIDVEEGAPAHVKDVHLAGLPADVEETARKEAARGGVVAGRVFDYAAYAALKGQLGDLLRQRGYAYAHIGGGVDVDRDRHTAVVELDAQPGPLVHMGETTLSGYGAIPAWKLMNRVTWKPGALYDPREIDRTQARLRDLGVFSSVRVDLPPEPTPTADVKIEVRPGKLHELRLGGGVGAELQRQEVRARGELTINNFLGGLRKLRLRVHPAYVVLPSVTDVQRSGVAATNDAQLTQPDLFGSDITLHVLAGYDVGIDYGYQYYGPRAQVGVDRPFLRDRLIAGASWNLQRLRFFNVDQDVFNGASDRFFGFENPYLLAYLDEFVQLDLRDRPLDPRYGGYFIVHAEQGAPALGGAFSYVKVSPDLRLYAPVTRRMVVAVRGQLGWLRPSGVGDSPITRRFSLGGPSSHRGFGFGRLAPQAIGESGNRIPVGGDGAVLFSGEVRVDVLKISGAWLGVVPFVDLGDVTARFQDLDLGDLHIAAGGSLEYATPIGAVRVGLGVRLNRLEGNVPDPGNRYAFHITIGEAF
jgi:translocation and assembly module TamA